MRGQAFIVFESPTTSTAAKRGLSGFSFYGKELHISYSTGSKSKALLRRELGTEAVQELDLEKSKTTVSRRGEKRGLFMGGEHEGENELEEEVEGDEGEGRKRVKLEQEEASEEGKMVVAKGVPGSIEEEVLSALFSRQEGYVEVSKVNGVRQEGSGNGEDREGSWTARVRFDTKENAELAKDKLDGIQIDPTYKLQLDVV